jgi:signal transduction histidine kinase
VASVSHELKTPLTAIRMFAETLARATVRDPHAREEYLMTIVNETERLSRLLNNVLDFSRIERGQREYQLRPTALDAVVHRSARTLEYPLSQQGLSLRVDVADDVPLVQADEDALQQAVLNLLTNAMKYSGSSSEIDLTLQRSSGEAIIRVRDHGLGIPTVYRDRVVEKFFRVPSAETAGIPGAGLGLTLVDHIVRGHGGRLEIESLVGSGSTFSIHLPVGQPS